MSIGNRRGHPFVFILRKNASDEFTQFGFSWNDREKVRRAIGNVEPKPRLAFVGVRAVAGKAIFREDGPDVAIKFWMRGLRQGLNRTGKEKGRDAANQASSRWQPTRAEHGIQIEPQHSR